MRKKPYLGSELFNEIVKRIELPDIIDYANGSYKREEILNYEWDFANDLEYGSNEGIYLTMYAESENKKILLGVFKTLGEDKDALRKMALLLAEFIYAGKVFVNNNLDDFTWTGYKVSPEGEDWGYDCPTIERARERQAKMLETYSKVTIFDYEKRKEVS